MPSAIVLFSHRPLDRSPAVKRLDPYERSAVDESVRSGSDLINAILR